MRGIEHRLSWASAKNEVARTGPSATDVETVTTFEVERTWKGPSQRSIKVTACGGGDVVCTVSIEFIPGRDYLVFASGNRFLTSMSNAFDANKSDELLQWLRQKPSRTMADPPL